MLMSCSPRPSSTRTEVLYGRLYFLVVLSCVSGLSWCCSASALAGGPVIVLRSKPCSGTDSERTREDAWARALENDDTTLARTVLFDLDAHDGLLFYDPFLKEEAIMGVQIEQKSGGEDEQSVSSRLEKSSRFRFVSFLQVVAKANAETKVLDGNEPRGRWTTLLVHMLRRHVPIQDSVFATESWIGTEDSELTPFRDLIVRTALQNDKALFGQLARVAGVDLFSAVVLRTAMTGPPPGTTTLPVVVSNDTTSFAARFPEAHAAATLLCSLVKSTTRFSRFEVAADLVQFVLEEASSTEEVEADDLSTTGVLNVLRGVSAAVNEEKHPEEKAAIFAPLLESVERAIVQTDRVLSGGVEAEGAPFDITFPPIRRTNARSTTVEAVYQFLLEDAYFATNHSSLVSRLDWFMEFRDLATVTVAVESDYFIEDEDRLRRVRFFPWEGGGPASLFFPGTGRDSDGGGFLGRREVGEKELAQTMAVPCASVGEIVAFDVLEDVHPGLARVLARRRGPIHEMLRAEGKEDEADTEGSAWMTALVGNGPRKPTGEGSTRTHIFPRSSSK